MRLLVHFLGAAALACGICTPVISGQSLVHEYVPELRGPMKLAVLGDENILVAEAGAGPNTGRISVIDRDRRRFTIVDGLHLTGFPFAAGNASVQLVDRHTGVATPLVTGLQTAIDVLPVARGTGLLYVLEHSRQLLTGAPGRLLRIDAPDRAPLVLADGLDAPTSLAIDPVTRDILITELRRNRIIRVQIP